MGLELRTNLICILKKVFLELESGPILIPIWLNRLGARIRIRSNSVIK